MTDPKFPQPLPLPPILGEIRAGLPTSDAYLVGGAVRDSLLSRPVYDIDIALRGDGVEAARNAANALGAACYPLDSERGVGRVILVRNHARYTLDFASLRGRSIAEDLAARDFTINAIAVPLDRPGERIDPTGGAGDLQAGILRACSPDALRDDPVRVIRAVRLATQLDLRVEEETQAQARAAASRLVDVSAERIRDEFFRILTGKRVAAGIRLLTALGILPRILPETAGLEKTKQPPPHRYDVWTHTLAALEHLDALFGWILHEDAGHAPAEPALARAAEKLARFRPALAEHLSRPLSDDRPVFGLVFLAALLHDAAKTETRSVAANGEVHFIGHEQMGGDWAFRRATGLRFSREEADYTAQIVRHHMRPAILHSAGEITRRAIFRYYRGTGPSGVAVCLFSLADFLAKHGTVPPLEWDAALAGADRLLEGWFERGTEMVHPVPHLSGNDLIREFHLTPGPQLGELLDALREAQAAGEVCSRDDALALVARSLGRAPG